jgi:hypothetical protein
VELVRTRFHGSMIFHICQLYLRSPFTRASIHQAVMQEDRTIRKQPWPGGRLLTVEYHATMESCSDKFYVDIPNVA